MEGVRNILMERMRSCSSVFSRGVFSKIIIKFQAASLIEAVGKTDDFDLPLKADMPILKVKPKQYRKLNLTFC